MKVLCDSYYKDGSYKEEEIPDSLPQQEPSLPNKVNI